MRQRGDRPDNATDQKTVGTRYAGARRDPNSGALVFMPDPAEVAIAELAARIDALEREVADLRTQTIPEKEQGRA